MNIMNCELVFYKNQYYIIIIVSRYKNIKVAYYYKLLLVFEKKKKLNSRLTKLYYLQTHSFHVVVTCRYLYIIMVLDRS